MNPVLPNPLIPPTDPFAAFNAPPNDVGPGGATPAGGWPQIGGPAIPPPNDTGPGGATPAGGWPQIGRGIAPPTTPPTPVPTDPNGPQIAGPTGASWIDANGNAQNTNDATQVPIGTPYRTSAALTNGGTQTDSATPTNAFAGYTGPQGGQFGGVFGSDIADPAAQAAAQGKNASTLANLAQQSGGAIDWTKVDPAALSQMAQTQAKGGNSTFDVATGASSGNDQALALQAKVANGGTLTPTEQAYIASTGQDATSKSPYRFDANGNATFDPALGLQLGVNKDGTKVGAASPSTGYYDYMKANGQITDAQYQQLTAAQAQNQARIASEAASPAPSHEAATVAPVDADPFGRFDTANSPAHGVITPQYENQLATQSMQLGAPLTPATIPVAGQTAPVDPFAPFQQQPAKPAGLTTPSATLGAY